MYKNILRFVVFLLITLLQIDSGLAAALSKEYSTRWKSWTSIEHDFEREALMLPDAAFHTALNKPAALSELAQLKAYRRADRTATFRQPPNTMYFARKSDNRQRITKNRAMRVTVGRSV